MISMMPQIFSQAKIPEGHLYIEDSSGRGRVMNLLRRAFASEIFMTIIDVLRLGHLYLHTKCGLKHIRQILHAAITKTERPRHHCRVTNAEDQRHQVPKANVVFCIDALAACILDHIDTFENMLAFINVNQTTRRIYERYHRAALIRALSLYKKSICEIVTTLVVSPELRNGARFYDWNSFNTPFNPRTSLYPQLFERITRPVYTLEKMTAIQLNVERTVKSLAWPNGRHLPYNYYYRTRPGALFVHCLTAENVDCQRRIEKNLRVAMWQLHLFNELFYVDIPSWLDTSAENLWAQVAFLSSLAMRELIELFRLYRNLYRKAKKSKHPRFKALSEQLRIGEHGLKAVKDPIEAQVPVLWLKKHLIYQLSIGLPLLLRAFDPPETIKPVRLLDKEGLMYNAVKSHLSRRQQRIALWVQDVYKWNGSSINFFGRIIHDFSDSFTFEDTG